MSDAEEVTRLDYRRGSASLLTCPGMLRPARVTLDDVTRIGQTSEAALRNLLITQCYHDLSHELASAVDHGSANWSTFATWASKTAGQSIGIPTMFTGLEGTTFWIKRPALHAYRCGHCRIILFKYGG